MNEQIQKVKESLGRLLSVYTDYLTNFERILLHAKGDQPWFWRVEDIYFKEAPKTVTQLILALHLTDRYNITFRVANDEDIVSVFSAMWSLNESSEIWQTALSTYQYDKEVIRLTDQLGSLSFEIKRALENIQ